MVLNGKSAEDMWSIVYNNANQFMEILYPKLIDKRLENRSKWYYWRAIWCIYLRAQKLV
jgi:hypothetical protein